MEMTPDAVKAAVAEMEGGDDEAGDGDGQINVDEFEDWWFRTKYQCPKIAKVPVNTETGSCLFLEEVAFRGQSTLRSPGDTMFGVGEYPKALRLVLSGAVAITEYRNTQDDGFDEERHASVTIRNITCEDREPAFGFAAAIDYENRQRIISPIDNWVVEATAYSDVLSISLDDLEELYKEVWPQGPAEFLKLAKAPKVGYRFDLTKQVPPRKKKALPFDQQLAALEAKVTEKLAEMDENFETALSAIVKKLDEMSNKAEFGGIG